MANILEQLIDTTNEIHQLVSARMRHCAELSGGTFLQIKVLHTIHDHPGMTTTELANLFGVSASAATQLIDRLVLNKALKREDDPKDRRVSHLFLTEDGKKEVHQFMQARRKEISRIFDHLSDSDMTELLRINTLIVEAIRKDSADQPSK